MKILFCLLLLPLAAAARKPPCYYTSYENKKTGESVIASELDDIVIKRVVKNGDTAFYLDFCVITGDSNDEMADTARGLGIYFEDGTSYASDSVLSTLSFSKMIFYRLATLKVNPEIETLLKNKTVSAIRLGPVKRKIDEYNAVNLPIWVKCLMD